MQNLNNGFKEYFDGLDEEEIKKSLLRRVIELIKRVLSNLK